LGERESYYPVKENLRRNNLEKIEKGKQRREIKNPIKSIKDRIGNSINFIIFFSFFFDESDFSFDPVRRKNRNWRE
jgi:hypothetical protein